MQTKKNDSRSIRSFLLEFTLRVFYLVVSTRFFCIALGDLWAERALSGFVFFFFILKGVLSAKEEYTLSTERGSSVSVYFQVPRVRRLDFGVRLLEQRERATVCVWSSILFFFSAPSSTALLKRRPQEEEGQEVKRPDCASSFFLCGVLLARGCSFGFFFFFFFWCVLSARREYTLSTERGSSASAYFKSHE